MPLFSNPYFSVKEGEFFAKCTEDGNTSCFRYGKELYYEETTVLKYFPSQIDHFVKKLPKDLVDAVLKAYVEPTANISESNEEEHNGANM